MRPREIYERLRDYLENIREDRRFEGNKEIRDCFIDVYPEYHSPESIEKYHDKIGFNAVGEEGDVFVTLDYKVAREMAEHILELCKDVDNIKKRLEE